MTTEDGLQGSHVDGPANRCSIVPIYNANSSMAHYLRTMWANKSPEEAYEILKQASNLPRSRLISTDLDQNRPDLAWAPPDLA